MPGRAEVSPLHHLERVSQPILITQRVLEILARWLSGVSKTRKHRKHCLGEALLETLHLVTLYGKDVRSGPYPLLLQNWPGLGALGALLLQKCPLARGRGTAGELDRLSRALHRGGAGKWGRFSSWGARGTVGCGRYGAEMGGLEGPPSPTLIWPGNAEGQVGIMEVS